MAITSKGLAGLPIIFTTTSSNIEDATFHRLRIVVTVNTSVFEFSSPVDGVQTVSFDISSAIRAVADCDKPSASTFSYNAYSASITVYEEYMKDGEFHTSSGSSGGSTDSVYNGTVSDRARLFSGYPAKWSLKPSSSPQLAFVNSSLIFAGNAYGGVSGESLTAPSVSASSVLAGNQSSYYGIPAPHDGYEIRFINSMGVHENVFVVCLRKAEVGYTTERHIISRQETIDTFSRGITLKKNNHERWKMSTHPLDREWQEWYLHEFLMARWAWVKVSNQYIPVHILPGDTTTAIDRPNRSPLTVEFEIEFDINGSPF